MHRWTPLLALGLLTAGAAQAADIESVALVLEFAPALDSYSASAVYTVRFEEQESSLELVRAGGERTVVPREGALTVATLTWTGGDRDLSVRDGFVFAGFDTAGWLPLPATERGPDLIADAFVWDLTLVLPPGLSAVGSGSTVPSDARPDGRVAHRFVLESPTRPYLLGFAAGPFARREETLQRPDGTTVLLQYLLCDETAFVERFGSTGPALLWMEAWTGARYPDAVYTQVLLPGGAAQEKAGFALLGARTVALADAAPDEAWYVIHELSHQWFGRQLGAGDWSENWLNEGFAVLATMLFSGGQWGAERGAAEVSRARTRYARAIERGQDRPLRVPGWKTPGDGGGPIAYTKALLVLDLLRRQVGAKPFDAGIAALFAAEARNHADFTSEALLSALAKASGVDLSDIGPMWVDGPGEPAQLLTTTP